VLYEGVTGLIQNPDPVIGTWGLGSLAIASGISLLVGFLTPIAAAIVGAGAVGISVSTVPALHLLTSRPLCAFFAALAFVIVLLGPGAFSLDARLFGLREIFIPRSRSSE
jgi:uncharacterized membrane protein YphA (DoxX/SURF4 family)